MHQLLVGRATSRANGRIPIVFMWRAARVALVVLSCGLPSAAGAQEITFSVTGDVPYGESEIPEFQQQIDDHNLYSRADFMVHVGDILAGNEPCEESRYITVSNMLQDLAVPAFIVPGDNEWTDCLDPNQGWSYWMAHLFELDQNFCGTPSVERQSGREENFAFVQSGVLFVGINLVGGSNDSAIMQDDADWVSQQLSSKASQVRAAVVFAQAGEGNNRATFFDQFSSAAASFSKPILYIHGDGHSWQQQNSFLQPNVTRVQIDRGDKPPVHVTVAASGGNPFSFDRSPWSGSSALYNRPPCVDAGPDRSISVSQPANLLGIASDDGVPNDPVDFTTTWTKVSGPSGVTIADPTSPSTSAIFTNTGTYVFQLEGNDGGISTTDQMQVVVSSGPPVNQPPVAVSESYEILKGATLNVSAPGVLSNDSDADGDLLTAVLVTSASFGSLSLSGDGSFSYAPNADFAGQDSFTYRAHDGLDTSSLTTVTIDVIHFSKYFAPVHDTQVNSALPLQNLGADDELRVEQDATVYHSYLKFQVSGTKSAVYGTKLRLRVTNSSDEGGTIHPVADYYPGTVTAWTESGLIWNNKPVIGTPALDSVANPDEGTWVEFDVSDAIVGDGTYSFGLQTTSDNSVEYSTKEGNFPPELVVDTEPNGPGLTNSAPSASGNSYVTDQGDAVVVLAPGVLANDTDANGDSLSVVHFTAPSNGSVNVAADGGFTYTPNPTFTGSDAFTYYVVDGRGGLDSGSVTITVNIANDPPVANDNSYGVDEDQVLSVAAPGVLGNDSDPDGHALTAALASGPANGTVTLNSDGSFAYTPNPDFFGDDSFTYTANDGFGGASAASVSIGVQGLPDAPVALDDNYVAAEDSVLNVVAPGVMANDTDADGDSLNVSLSSGPTHGTLTLNVDGSFSYLPNAEYSGSDSFVYALSDGNAGIDSATVSLDVESRNDAPVAAGEEYTTDEDVVLSVAAPGVLSNDTDIDGDALTSTLSTAPSNGSASVNPDGSFTYTPDADFHGSDSFDYIVSDGRGGSATQTVSLTVEPQNDAPSPSSDSYSVDEDGTLDVVAPGVLANDVDVDGDALTAVLSTLPARGTASMNSDGSLTYTPDPNFHGVDSLTYTASDGNGSSTAADVQITVQAQNDAPVASPDSYTLDEDATLSEPAPGVLVNDGDVDGDAMIASLDTAPTNGTVTVNADGSFSYTPDPDFNGDDSFTYVASDGNGGTDVATVSLTIMPANDIPSTVEDAYSTPEDVSLVVAAPGMLQNDSDSDGDTLVAVLGSPPINGVAVVNADGSFTYTPNPDYNGADSFSYLADDGNGGSANGTVSISVDSVNDAPTTAPDSFNLNEDGDLRIKQAERVLRNDSDVDGDALTASMVIPPLHGTVASFSASGTFTYTPDANFSGVDSLVYAADDGNGGVTNGIAKFTVINTNDAPTALADTYNVDEDEPAIVDAPGVLGNDTDVDGDVLTSTLSSGPTNGAVTLQTDGSFTYTPNAGFTGSDTFSYTASDGNGSTSSATVTLNVAFVNDPPTTVVDSYSVDEDSVLSIAPPGVLANDSDEEGDPLSASLGTPPTHGTLSLNSDGSFTYTPDANYNGPDSFTYVADDGNGGTTESVTLTVSSVNDSPAATADEYSVAEDTLLSVDAPGVLANDTDADGDSLSSIIVSPVSNGTLVLAADGSFTYAPDANFNGSDSFVYAAADGNGGSTQETVSLTVQPANDTPSTTPDVHETDEDVPLVVAAPGVLGNDIDVDGDSLTTTVDSGPSNGLLSLNLDGSFTYTPDAQFNGADSFTYTADDGAGGTAIDSVWVTVHAQNDVPTTLPDAYSTSEDSALTVAAPGVLVNDSDVDGDTLRATVSSAPTQGTLALNADGSFTYTPDANFNGADSFTYTASDGQGGSSIETVSLSIESQNDPPSTGSDAFTANEDESLSLPAPGVLANDSDPDGDALTCSVSSPPANGTLTLNLDGSFIYTPDADFSGADGFSYVAHDGNGASVVETVSIDVTAANDAPTAVSDAYSTDEDSTLTVPVPGVLGNDTDADGDSLTVTVDSDPSNGVLNLSPDGSFTYTPAADFNGADAFTYAARDGNGGSSIATVSLSIQARNDSPTTNPDAYSTDEDTPLSLSAPGVLANDSDVDGDSLTAALSSPPSNGTLVLNADGSFTYTPDAEFSGADGFAYSADDGNGGVVVGSVSIDVVAANDAPATQPDTYSTQEDSVLTVVVPGVLANDSDVEGDALSAALLASPANGSVVLATDGSFVYTPDPNYFGSDGFTYLADDANGGTSSESVSIDVQAVNDAPVAAADVYGLQEDSQLSQTAPGVLANDSDIEGDSLTAFVETLPANGTLTLLADGSFDYVPDVDFAGTDTFSYRAEDGNGGSSVAMVTLDVGAANDPPVGANDGYTTDEDVALYVDAPGVLANDSDSDGDSLTVSLVIAPTQGVLQLGSAGDFSYTPGANFYGVDSFAYAVHDAAAADTAFVVLTVRSVGDAPVAGDDNYSVDEDSTLVVAAPGVLLNDSDVEGDSLSAALISGPTNGTLSLHADGSFTYTPAPQFSGLESFLYAALDSTGLADSALVRITVGSVNDAPVASPDSFSIVAGDAISVGGIGVLLNDVDADGDSLVAILVNDVSHGTLSLDTGGSFTYTPESGYVGDDSFTYRAGDGALESAAVQVLLRVTTPQVRFAESVSGSSSGSLSVAAQSELVPVDAQLYVAAISTTPRRTVQSVAGMGLLWTRVETQCSGRSETGVDLWIAQGTPSAGVVSAAFGQAPSHAAILVARYEGVATVGARGGSIALNSNGEDGACHDGIDSSAYTFDMTTTSEAGVVLLAAAALDQSHVAGPGFQTLASEASGDAGTRASVYLAEKPCVAGTQTLSGSFDAAVDWAVVALEVRATAPESTPTSVERRPAELAESRPNPFNAGTTLKYRLHHATPVEIVVYNVRGQIVRRLVHEVQGAGAQRVYWDARTDAGIHTESGVYFIRIRLGETTYIRKIILVK